MQLHSVGPGFQGLARDIKEDLVHAQALRCAEALQDGLNALAGRPAQSASLFSSHAALCRVVNNTGRHAAWLGMPACQTAGTALMSNKFYNAMPTLSAVCIILRSSP